MLRQTKTPHPRKVKKSLDEEPWWYGALFALAMLFILSQGAIVFAPLYWLGIIPLY